MRAAWEHVSSEARASPPTRAKREDDFSQLWLRPNPTTNGPAGCGVHAAASVAKVAARYLALPVVPDGMIISVTCLSLGLTSRTSLFASLVYS